MTGFEISLLLSTLLCGLVAGLVLGFAIVVMPGIAVLMDRDYLRAFQVIDAVIQRGHPIFGAVWVGSALAALVCLGLGFLSLEGLDRALLSIAAVGYLLGVQVPTAVVNIPMNNALQALDLEVASDDECRVIRSDFEARWNRWNVARTIVATVSALLFALIGMRV